MILKWILFIIGSSLCVQASVPLPTPLVTVENAKLSDLSDNLAYPARVESRVNSLIYAESDGVVAKINAPLGSTVRRGTPLIIVKHTDPVFQYAPMVMKSQVAGIVSQAPVSEGSTVKKGDLLVAVTDPTQLRILIEVAASDLPLFKTGMEGNFSISGSEEKIKIQVAGVSPFVDPATGTATCELKLENKEGVTLRPGSVGQAFFKVSEHKGFIVPESAIVYRGADTYIRLVAGGKARKVPVTLGRRDRGNVEIIKGIKEGDQVVERSSGFISDGDKVQIETGGN